MTLWSDDPRLDDVWADPCDFLPKLRERTDAILAALHAANARDDRGDLIEIDHGAVAGWLDSASRDFDVDPDAAA